MSNGKNKDDFEFDSFSEDIDDFDDLFDDSDIEVPDEVDTAAETTGDFDDKSNELNTFSDIPQQKKRTAQDFEPDMDALLLTAQSSMIIEGMKCYSNKNYMPDTLQIYIEAAKGVELYIKILNRNPENYLKLKELIDSDMECQQVEKIAFNLFKQTYNDIAETSKEKIKAYKLLHNLLNECVQKAAITNSIKKLKRYYLLSGGIDTEKVQEYYKKGDKDLEADVKELHHNVKIALEMLKKGKSELTAGMKGRDLNMYILNSTELLSLVYKLQGNKKIAEYYERINTINKKYFLIQE